jgi:hypothetical protein
MLFCAFSTTCIIHSAYMFTTRRSMSVGPFLRYLALNDWRIGVTSRPRLSRKYVCVATDQAANA